MNLDRVRALARFYEQVARELHDLHEKSCQLGDEFCDYEKVIDLAPRLAALCDEARVGGSWNTARAEKAMRWLGFIQGVLWSAGDFNVDDLKTHSRPDREPPDFDAWRREIKVDKRQR